MIYIISVHSKADMRQLPTLKSVEILSALNQKINYRVDVKPVGDASGRAPHLRTHAQTNGQHENIMPPDPDAWAEA